MSKFIKIYTISEKPVALENRDDSGIHEARLKFSEETIINLDEIYYVEPALYTYNKYSGKVVNVDLFKIMFAPDEFIYTDKDGYNKIKNELFKTHNNDEKV